LTIVPGARIGGYEVLSLIGAGGMGEVYRARDTHLDRHVAIKSLPDALRADSERAARFEREAKLLATLNHPNIATIHGLEHVNGDQFIVMELVEGETLADRIARGPLPLDEALSIVLQIAEALEAAHEAGVIHRDLKPANIKVRADGTVKVLDFGLAKALSNDSSTPSAVVTNSPTITSPAGMTGVGVLLGTAAYMAPEQARGRAVDKRADIWAFGCVCYETLTGRRAFEGEDVSDTLAAVLRGEPDWRALPKDLMPALRTMIEGCLTKDRRERIGDFSTVRYVFKKAPSLLEPQRAPQVQQSRRAWYAAGVAAAALAASAATAVVTWRPAAAPPTVARFTLPLPEGQTFTSTGRQFVAISPDGTQLAYIANSRIFLRAIADVGPRAIPGTDDFGNISNLTFSPDGQSLAFWVPRDGSLKRIGVAGGAAVTICPVPTNPLGMSWPDATILFSQSGTGILRVPETGGKPEVVVPAAAPGDEGGLIMFGPQQLPGDAVMFSVARTTAISAIDRWDKAHIVVQSLRSGQKHTLIEGGSDARYVSTGHLLFARGGTLFAVPFDSNRLQATGTPVPVLEGVRRNFAANTAPAHAALSSNGSLFYVPGPAFLGAGQSGLGFADRKGNVEMLKLSPEAFGVPRVSPDGTQVAYVIDDERQTDIWVYALSGTSAARRLTFGGKNRYPVWSADGLRIAFQSDREADAGIWWQPAAGGPAERLTKADQGVAHVPTSWSPDGTTLLFEAVRGSEASLRMMTMSDRQTAAFGDVQSNSITIGATFSPDGRWVAYQSGGYAGDRTFVEPFPPTGTKFQIGRGGRPLWSRDGKELFFVPLPGQFVVVGVTTRPAFAFTTPTPVPRSFPSADPTLQRPFDMAGDGRFVVVTSGESQPAGVASRMELVLNWHEELKQRVPTR